MKRKHFISLLIALVPVFAFGVYLFVDFSRAHLRKVYISEGMSEFDRGNYSKAVEDFERAQSFSSNNLTAQVLLCKAYEKNGERSKSALCWRKVIAARPTSYSAETAREELAKLDD